MSEKVPGHAFREKRGTGGRVSWACACGEPLGNTKEGMTRDKARTVHREHKASVGIVRVATSGIPAEKQARMVNESREAIGLPPIGEPVLPVLPVPRRRWIIWRGRRKRKESA